MNEHNYTTNIYYKKKIISFTIKCVPNYHIYCVKLQTLHHKFAKIGFKKKKNISSFINDIKIIKKKKIVS